MVTYAQCDNLYSPLSNDNFKENNTKPLSIGVGLKAGIILADKVQLHAGYNQGLSRLNGLEYGGTKQRTISVGTTYMF